MRRRQRLAPHADAEGREDVSKCTRCGGELSSGSAPGEMLCVYCKYAPPLAPVGWICPKCGAGIAPQEPQCPNCKPPVVVTSSVTGGPHAP
jgi:hypothetical protein